MKSDPTHKPSPAPPSQWHGLISVIFNIVLPVMILHRLSAPWGALRALYFALAFPVAFGIFDYFKAKKLNWLSLLGLVNVSVTGSLAVLGLGGLWFCVKEAFFPFLIGLFVFISAFGSKPFIKTIFFNPQLLHLEKIEGALSEIKNRDLFERHLKNSTLLLSASFFLSAALNFFLSLRIFTDLDPTLTSEQKSLVLNSQIAQMTQWSFMVILGPSLIFLIFILWHLLRGIRQLTGLTTEDILKQ